MAALLPLSIIKLSSRATGFLQAPLQTLRAVWLLPLRLLQKPVRVAARTISWGTVSPTAAQTLPPQLLTSQVGRSRTSGVQAGVIKALSISQSRLAMVFAAATRATI